jgi:hypothetical protein
MFGRMGFRIFELTQYGMLRASSVPHITRLEDNN